MTDRDAMNRLLETGKKRQLDPAREKLLSQVNRLMETGVIKSLEGPVVPRIDILTPSFSWEQSDRVTAKDADYLFARLVTEERFAEVMAKHGAIPTLVKHLQAPPLGEGDQREKHLEHQVQEGSAAILTVLAENVSWV